MIGAEISYDESSIRKSTKNSKTDFFSKLGELFIVSPSFNRLIVKELPDFDPVHPTLNQWVAGSIPARRSCFFMECINRVNACIHLDVLLISS